MKRPRFRTQVQTGQIMVAFALFLAAPVAKPTLWILEIWGNLSLPGWLWPLIFGIVGLVLLRTRQHRVAQYAMMIGAVLYWTVAGASYLTLGMNSFSVMTILTGIHAVQTAIDLKARADSEDSSGGA